MTTMTHNWKPSEAQVNLLKTIFAERVPNSEPNREQFWQNLTQNISNRASFQSALDALKARPRVETRPTAVVPVERETLATEDGLYRNPQDGTLYRLSTAEKRNSWDRPTTYVSVFSVKATQRRLTVKGERVKGKWNRLKAQASRQMLRYSRWDREGDVKVLADWFMSEQDKMDFQYGICLFCYRGLEDERSVRHNYGPVCARRFGLPWND